MNKIKKLYYKIFFPNSKIGECHWCSRPFRIGKPRFFVCKKCGD